MPSYEPEKLHRVDDPPLRTPRVAVNNMLLVQPDNTITFGSPKVASRQHGVVGRTLSADSYCLSSKHLTCDGHSPAPPRVAVNNMLLVQPDNTITFGSPKVARRQHGVVGRTLSADSYCLSSKHLTCDGHSPARSSRSSRTSSTGKRSRASSVSERSHFANCDYVDDFDESSDVDEGYVSYYV